MPFQYPFSKKIIFLLFIPLLFFIPSCTKGSGGSNSSSQDNNITINLKSIDITPKQVSIKISGMQQFNATGTYSDGSKKDITSTVNWVSSNSDVATVNKTGLVTAVKEGTVEIAAKFENFVEKGSLVVIAKPPSTTLFSPYFDMGLDTKWNNDGNNTIPNESKMGLDQGIKSYQLAFITEYNNSCSAAWGGVYPIPISTNPSLAYDPTIMMKDLREKNIAYVISFGGAGGTDLSVDCSSDQLAAIFQNVVTTYNPSGLDFDIETPQANENFQKIITALVAFQKTNPVMPISFTLPVMPDGLVENGKNIVIAAKNAKLNYSINIMAMDYYSDGRQINMGDAAVSAATALFTFLKSSALYPSKSDADIWQMIEVTPMIGVNDTNEEFTLADARKLTTFAQEKKLKGLSMWSINRDHPCATKGSVDNHCSGNSLQSKDYEFSQYFMGTAMTNFDILPFLKSSKVDF